MTWRTLKGIKCLIKAEGTDYNSIHLNNSWTLVIFPSRQTYNLAVLCIIILKCSTIFIYLRKRIRILPLILPEQKFSREKNRISNGKQRKMKLIIMISIMNLILTFYSSFSAVLCPVVSYLVVSNNILFYSLLPCPVLSYPVPILSNSLLFLCNSFLIFNSI